MRSALRLRRIITVCGAINLAVFAWIAATSYGIAPHAPFERAHPAEADLFRRLAQSLDGLIPGGSGWLESYLAGNAFPDTAWRILAYVGPFAISIACFVVLFRTLRRYGNFVDADVVKRLFRFGVAFAALNILAYPMLAADMWLYVGWGRMLAAGLNPYYFDPSLADLSGLPIGELGSRLTYGPMWALVSGGIAFIAGGSAFWSFLLMKVLLAGCWIATLWLLLRVTSEDAPLDRAVAVAVFAWIPFSARTAIGDGHNDIVMLLPMVLWLCLLRRSGHRYTWLTLSASVLVKYVTAPLVALELLAARVARVPVRRYAASMGSVALGAVVLFLLFFRDFGMFRGLIRIRGLSHFWTPAEAVSDALARLGWALPAQIPNVLIAFVGLGFCFRYATRYATERRFADFAAATLALLMTILFSALGHVWPWFILWLVPVAALAWRSLLARVAIAMALLAPMLDVWWLRSGGSYSRQDSGILFYVLLGAVVTTASWWWPVAGGGEEAGGGGEP